MALIRLQEACSNIPILGRILRRIVWYILSTMRGCEIDLSATFGPGLRLPHPHGITIGPYAFGSNATIMQNVTVGRRDLKTAGTISVGNHVLIAAGAQLLGTLTVGDNAVIGGNAVVLKDVPADHLAIGVPAVNKQMKQRN